MAVRGYVPGRAEDRWPGVGKGVMAAHDYIIAVVHAFVAGDGGPIRGVPLRQLLLRTHEAYVIRPLRNRLMSHVSLVSMNIDRPLP